MLEKGCLARVGTNATLNNTDLNGGITLCQSDFFDIGKKRAVQIFDSISVLEKHGRIFDGVFGIYM